MPVAAVGVAVVTAAVAAVAESSGESVSEKANVCLGVRVPRAFPIYGVSSTGAPLYRSTPI